MQLDLELYRESVVVEPTIRISYIDVAPERPLHTLVFIHGFGGRARQWRYQIEQFARENRVIAIDLRGHGRSARPRSGYEMKRMLADVTAVLDHLQIRQPFVMVGHSFGVAFATEFAWRYPQRVSHLILIAGAGEYDIPGYFKLLFRLPPPVIRFLEPVAEKAVGASMRSLRRTFLDNMRHWRGWEMFPELRMPTMVIMGNKDRVLPQDGIRAGG